jgi:uncharacterized membrane protein YkoI
MVGTMKTNLSHFAAITVSALFFIGAPMMVAGYTASREEASTLEQDDARQAVKAGLIRPLEEILGQVRKSIDGDIVEIEFEKDDGRFIYEIEYVRRDGQLMEMKIDARTLAVIEDGEDD